MKLITIIVIGCLFATGANARHSLWDKIKHAFKKEHHHDKPHPPPPRPSPPHHPPPHHPPPASHPEIHVPPHPPHINKPPTPVEHHHEQRGKPSPPLPSTTFGKPIPSHKAAQPTGISSPSFPQPTHVPSPSSKHDDEALRDVREKAAAILRDLQHIGKPDVTSEFARDMIKINRELQERDLPYQQSGKYMEKGGEHQHGGIVMDAADIMKRDAEGHRGEGERHHEPGHGGAHPIAGNVAEDRVRNAIREFEARLEEEERHSRHSQPPPPPHHHHQEEHRHGGSPYPSQQPASNVGNIERAIEREIAHHPHGEHPPHQEEHRHGGSPYPSQQATPNVGNIERAIERQIAHHPHHGEHQHQGDIPSSHPHHGHHHGAEQTLRNAVLKATACRLCNGDKIEDLEAINFTAALNEQILAEKAGHHNIGIAQ